MSMSEQPSLENWEIYVPKIPEIFSGTLDRNVYGKLGMFPIKDKSGKFLNGILAPQSLVSSEYRMT